MNVLFLEIDTENTWAVASLGPASLAAYLRRHGHEASLLRVSPDMESSDLVSAVRAIQPGLLGLSLTTRQWQRARDIVAAVRGELNIPVIAGGLHPTFSPEHVLREPGFDFVCLGEGEEALLELVEQLESGRVGSACNIWRRRHDRPELRSPVSSPDALPFVARDMLGERHGVVHISTQRGCPFSCAYCAAAQLNRMYGATSGYGRRRSINNVLRELAEIRNQAALNYVIFLDDTFTICPAWVRRFCEAYAAQFRVPFSLHARPDTVDRPLIQMLAQSGCAHIVYGVESGSFRVRQQIMHRPISNARMVDVFRVTREAGILVTANYMLGLPGETSTDLEQTLDLHGQLQPDDFGYFVFYPYPGTPLFQHCRESGYLPDNYLDLPANHHESILRLPELSAQEIADCYNRFTQLRQRAHLERLGGRVTERDREAIVESVRQCAATA